MPSSLRKAPRQLVRPAVRSCLSSNKLSVSNVFIAFFSLSRVCFLPSDGFCHRGKGCVDRGERTGSGTGALEKEAPPASSCRGKTRRGQRLRRGLPDPPTRGAAPSCDLEESSAKGPARCGFREAGPPLPFPPSSLQHQEKGNRGNGTSGTQGVRWGGQRAESTREGVLVGVGGLRISWGFPHFVRDVSVSVDPAQPARPLP